jgi:hypothetical protein
MIRPIHLRLASSEVSARTYHFRAFYENGERTMGWALVTVNDRTGELLIVSDWGNFSYIWGADPKSLGAANLTEFIGRMEDPHYITDKLRGKSDGREFSAEETTKRLIEDLQERRRDDISTYGRKPDIDGDNFIAFRHPKRRYLTHATYEEICEDLRRLDDTGTGDAACALYLERVPGEIHNYLDDIWERCATVETWESKHLRGFIVPAIIKACHEETERRFRELGTVAQLVQGALEGARTNRYRRSLPVCACPFPEKGRSNTHCLGASTQPLGTHCSYWGALCGGDPERDAHGSRSERARRNAAWEAERAAKAKVVTP